MCAARLPLSGKSQLGGSSQCVWAFGPQGSYYNVNPQPSVMLILCVCLHKLLSAYFNRL